MPVSDDGGSITVDNAYFSTIDADTSTLAGTVTANRVAVNLITGVTGVYSNAGGLGGGTQRVVEAGFPATAALYDPDQIDAVMFAAADAREGGFSPEGLEPRVTLQPLTDGREVVEDYRSLQLSLRAHPLSFLREQLAAEKIVRCGDLASIRDGRQVEVAGVILVRQRPGSARGVLFITIEDETGVANGILWPDRFEKQRRAVMSASMVSLRGRLQKEGQVIHVIVDRVVPRDEMLRSIGRMDMPVPFGRGDGATHAGSPDRGDPGWKPRDLYSPPFPNGADTEDLIKVRSHDFH
ncbi:MAG: hypothetical protein KKA78_17250 [Alphaproteobacteria bacterium]|nr:hypothetical protein [Alphaproteobacteria bacterium]